MKVLHVLQSNMISGAENVVADICMMYKSECEMIYCSPDGPIRQALADRDVNYFPLRKLNFNEVRRAIKEYEPDIIHAHDVRATVITAWAAGKIPFISHLHVNKDDMRTFGFKPCIYLLATKKAKKVIVVSESCLNEYIFKKKIEKKTICLRNIIYASRIEMLISKDVNDYNFDFVYIGRISHQKNPQRVAEVASVVLKQFPTATFGVIGDGDLKEEMVNVFKENGVADRVIFAGRLDYPYKVLKQAKCMLMCSRFEGTPISVLEAMALGVPVVSTPVDGIVNIVHSNETGYLFSDNELLANAVRNLLMDSKLQQMLSNNCMAQLKMIMDQEEYKETLTNIYNNIVYQFRDWYINVGVGLRQ